MARQRETVPTLAKLSRGTQPDHTKQCHHNPSQSLGTVVSAQTTTDLTALSPADLTQVAKAFNQRLAQRAPFYAQHFVATTKPQGLSVDTWSQPAVYQQLLLDFAKAYPPLAKTTSPIPLENNPEQILLSHSHNSKALHSLWGQWYFGLLVPPMLEWIINAPHSLSSPLEQIEQIDIAPEHFYLRPHDSGRVAGFEFQLTLAPTPQVKTAIVKAAIVKTTVLTPSSERQLIKWIQSHLVPSVERLTGLSPTPAKLYWSHLGYLIHWYLGEMALPNIEFEHLKELLFNTKAFEDGEANPLYNSINLLPASASHADNIRRVCCLRYQLTNSHRCGDCPLATRAQAKRAAQA